ncbi:MAG TPA: aminoglycoside phosphotransferase family protein [Candidatus Krumholzibacteria bacterium]|nr:aminoglycoside phosphotransferase family protein [Candidatus Krumholzibacteria bacterium]
MKALRQTILEQWDELGLGIPAPRTLDCLLRTPRFRASSHVLFFVFANDEREPVLIAKTPRLPDDHAFLDREVANLQKLAMLRPAELGSVPQVVSYRDWHGTKLLLETLVPGHPMSPAVVRANQQDCIESVMRWVTELHFASRAFVTGPTGSVRKHIESNLSRLATAFPESQELRKMLERTHEIVQPLATQVLPRVFEHGDLSSPNILLDAEGRVGVVDWELADATGLPATDVFFFLTYVAFARVDAAHSGRHAEAFAEAFFGSPAWARPYVLDYAKAVGLSARSLRPLFLLTWVRYASSLVARLHAEGPADHQNQGELLQWLTNNRFFVLWKFALEHWKELDL